MESTKDTVNPIDELTEEQQRDLMKQGGALIKKHHIEKLAYLANRDGVTTLTAATEGTKFPFRPKLVLYALRVSQGERVKTSKYVRIPVKPNSTVKRRVGLPGGGKYEERAQIERTKILVVTDNYVRSPEDERWASMSLRFSAAKTLLQEILDGLQKHKALDDDKVERINAVSEAGGNQKVKEKKNIQGGDDSAMEVRKE